MRRCLECKYFLKRLVPAKKNEENEQLTESIKGVCAVAAHEAGISGSRAVANAKRFKLHQTKGGRCDLKEIRITHAHCQEENDCKYFEEGKPMTYVRR